VQLRDIGESIRWSDGNQLGKKSRWSTDKAPGSLRNCWLNVCSLKHRPHVLPRQIAINTLFRDCLLISPGLIFKSDSAVVGRRKPVRNQMHRVRVSFMFFPLRYNCIIATLGEYSPTSFNSTFIYLLLSRPPSFSCVASCLEFGIGLLQLLRKCLTVECREKTGRNVDEDQGYQLFVN